MLEAGGSLFYVTDVIKINKIKDFKLSKAIIPSNQILAEALPFYKTNGLKLRLKSIPASDILMVTGCEEAVFCLINNPRIKGKHYVSQLVDGVLLNHGSH